MQSLIVTSVPFTIFSITQEDIVGSQFTFFHCLISCLHQCFANINFSSQFSNKRHFYFCDICTLTFVFVFTTVSVKTWSFEVALKSLLNCRYPSCRYAHCVYILLIIMQLAKLFDLYSLDIL
jgi:Ca2+/Na+ antiporter